MAEVTAMRNNALPYPVYAAPWTIVFPMLDADGDLVTGATTPDAEVSKNGDTFADCTNESTELATSSGMYYLTLTATEMTADIVAIIAKSATAGMKTTPMILYPRKLVSVRASTATAGAAGTITLDASASAIDDYYNGCLLVTTGGTGSGQSRIITDYVGSTKVASVTPNFATNPDNTTTFTIYLPEQAQYGQVDVFAFGGLVGVNAGGRPEVNASHFAGVSLPATNISKTGSAIGRGTATTGGSTTSVPTSAFTPAGAIADQFKNRVLMFDADTATTTLRGVAVTISASSNAATPTFTVAALPAAPASGDTFSVI